MTTRRELEHLIENIDKISFLPSRIVKEENHSSIILMTLNCQNYMMYVSLQVSITGSNKVCLQFTKQSQSNRTSSKSASPSDVTEIVQISSNGMDVSGLKF